MFISFELMDKSREFSISEYDKLKKLLPDIIPEKVKFKWVADIINDGILGLFFIGTPNTIYVADQPNSLKEMASTIAHELKHREQFFRNPFLYLILCIPIIRNYTIEIEAKKVEIEVDKRLGLTDINNNI